MYNKFFFTIVFLLFMQTAAVSSVCTSTLAVSAKVIPVCVIKPSTMTIQTTGQCLEAVGVCQFDIVCTNGVDASILANKGEHSAYSAMTTRALNCNKSYISYDLYTDAACQHIWDENYTLLYSSKTGLPYSITIYAKAYLNADILPGMYKDKVIIRPSCPGATITPSILDINLIIPAKKK